MFFFGNGLRSILEPGGEWRLFRTRLDLYANVIRCKSNPVVPTRHSDIDILVIRENTEGEYSSLEHEVHSSSLIEGRNVLFSSLVCPGCGGKSEK